MTQVYIDAGHDRRDPGAGSGGRHEHPETLEVLAAADRRLGELGISRSIDLSGRDPGFAGSAANANASGAKLALELHYDWSGGIDAAFGIYLSTAGERFATALTQSLKDHGFPIWKDGAVHEDEIGRTGLGFLHRTNAPAVILELGRIRDYPPEVNVRQGVAVAEGIAVALGVGIPAEEAKPPAGKRPDEVDLGGPFPDVPADGTHAASIRWAVERGLIEGKADGTFEPSEPLTRAQAATFARRLVAYLRELDRQDHATG